MLWHVTWLAALFIPYASAFVPLTPPTAHGPAYKELLEGDRVAPAIRTEDGRSAGANRAAVSISAGATPRVNQAPVLELPKPLSPVDRAKRAVTFWSRILPVMGKYALLKRQLEVRRMQGDVVSKEEEERMWNEAHEWGSTRVAETISELKGFYVKSGQVISSRVDLFPEQYTSKLQKLQDSLDPIPADVVKAVIRLELLEGEPIDLLFREFDDVPLGSASIAQVHRAVLADGRVVAVKVQRPAEEPKLRGDVANLKAFSKQFRESLPVDYYPIFCELEKALTNELDFLAEAQAIEKIAAAVAHTPDGRPAVPSVYVPRPIPGLVSKRVLIMDFVDGVPLNKLADRMKERGIDPGSPEAGVFGRRLLSSLTEAFSRMILGPGFLHGDPHPGNIFVMEGGRVALLDCGQVKQLSNTQRLRIADLALKVGRYMKPGGPSVDEIGEAVKAFGVELMPGAENDCAAALALLLFGDPDIPLPGGYSTNELGSKSPLRRIKKFPQELVMVGRATVLIKGMAARLGVRWSIAERLGEAARQALECGEDGCLLPIYASIPPVQLGVKEGGDSKGRTKFAEVRKAFREVRILAWSWAVGKALATMPASTRRWLAQRELARLKREEDKRPSQGTGGRH